MGVIIPAMVACVCPREGSVSAPPVGTRVVFDCGAWRLRPEIDEDDEEAWARQACPHGLIRAQAWPLASVLESLADVVRRREGPDARAVGSLLEAFGRRPSETGPLVPIAVAVDARHARGLADLSRDPLVLDLEELIRAAIETGHPVRLPDRLDDPIRA